MKCLGITDEITTCGCCGRADLKCTVAFESEAGEIRYFGRVCAAKYQRCSVKNIDQQAKAADQIKIERANDAYRNSSEYQALQARYAERNQLGASLMGLEAIKFVRSESAAANSRKSVIATQFGVKVSAIHW